MSRTATIKFRGEERDVSFKDYGPEPDVNAHVIEWEFLENRDADPPTEAEEQEIYDRLLQICLDSYGDEF